MDQTKKLLEKAVEEQLTGIIATPHAFHPNFQTNLAALKKQLELVNSYIAQEQLPLTNTAGRNAGYPINCLNGYWVEKP